MESVKDRNYYTLIELIYILRKHYLQAQFILDSMKARIQIDSTVPCNIDLYLHLKNTIAGQNMPCILLNVSKDINSSIGTKIRNRMNQFSFDEYRLALDSATFELVGEDNNYQFKQMEEVFYYYHPKAFIPESVQKEFSHEYGEVKKISLYSLPHLYVELNPFQSLFTFGSFLFISNNGEFNNGITISYKAKDDRIHIESSKKYSTYFIERLLLTKIPKYLLPDEYVLLLNDDSSKIDNVFIDSIIGRRREVLEFVECPKKLVLRRENDKGSK